MDTKSLNDISLGETMSYANLKESELEKEEIVNQKNFTEDDVENFKETAKKYFAIDDEMKILQKKMTLLRKDKLKYTKDILEFMEENSIKDVNTNSGKLRYTVSYKKESLNKKFIKTKLAEYFKSNDKALDCFKFIDNRAKKEQTKLKRFK